MSALHAALLVNDEAVGDLISVGNCFAFFAVRMELSQLDGATFRSIGEARRAAVSLLSGRPLKGNNAGHRTPAPGLATMQRGDDPWL